MSWILSKLPTPSGHCGWRGLPLHSAPAPSLSWGKGGSPQSQREASTPLRAARVSGSISWCSAMPVAHSKHCQISPWRTLDTVRTWTSQTLLMFSKNQTPILFTNRGANLICTNLSEIRSWLAMSIFASGLPGKNGWLKLIWNRS